jgi:hypothetical protein
LVKIDSEELRSFVSSTIESIEGGLKNKNYELKGYISFEVAVVNVKKGEGGVKLFVVDASGKFGKENISKIKFEIGKKMDVATARVFKTV